MRVTKKWLMEFVNGYATYPMQAVRVEIPRLRQNQVESASSCPRVLIRVEGGGRMGYYVYMPFSLKEATDLYRAGRRFFITETQSGKTVAMHGGNFS